MSPWSKYPRWRKNRSRRYHESMRKPVVKFLVPDWVDIKGLQRKDVVYLGWPISPSYISPNAGGGEIAGSQPIIQLYTGAQINFGELILYLTFGGYSRLGLGLLHRTARLRRLEARYDNPSPESTISPSQGLRIWPLLYKGLTADRVAPPYFQLIRGCFI